MSADGDWSVTLSTPMGPQKMTLSVKTAGGTFTGRTESPMGAQEVSGEVNGDILRWVAKVTSPMALTLDFQARVDGDRITGTCKLGSFGEAKLTGERDGVVAQKANGSGIHFDPYSMDFATDPYPLYKQLRDEAPVFHQEELNFWSIARYADVVAAHQDNVAFSSAGGVTIEPMPDIGLLIMKDMPEHRWHKALVTKVFTRGRMNNMDEFVRARCRALLDRAAQKGEFDFVGDFAVDLPLDVISELIGIPEEVRPDIHRFANMLLARGEVDPGAVYAAKLASDEVYLGLIRERRTKPRDDVITLLMNTELQDDEGVVRKLTDDELANRFGELAAAGHETVAKAIPNGAIALTRFPGERAKLQSDSSLMPGAVEEILRYEPPSQLQGRVTTREVEMHGKTIPAGARVMLLTGSATRDERKFDDPDVFDVSRENDVVSIYFGYGIHRCLGIHLARLEIRIAFEELFSRYPEWRVHPDQATRKVLTNVRGVATLPGALGARH